MKKILVAACLAPAIMSQTLRQEENQQQQSAEKPVSSAALDYGLTW